MRTPTELHHLELVLQNLKTKQNLNFEEVCELLFTFQYKDFDALFNISEMSVPDDCYIRVPVTHADYIVFLKIWGSKTYSCIRDHSNYDAKVKVLKGSLTEVNYRENTNFIEYDSRAIYRTGDFFAESEDDINSILNNSEDLSVSLHVYRTNVQKLEGIRIFNTETRQIAHLSKEAKCCAWDLPENAFQKISKV